MMIHKIVETKLEKKRNSLVNMSAYYLSFYKVIPDFFCKFAETVNFISDEEHDLSGRHTEF